jgi:Lrp/AsnC family leucine-responsive transcriptional regulator
MDKIDYEIIEHLQRNGRASVKKLAEKISLTPPAVAERIKKLEESGVITGYRAIINHKKLGWNISALINITLNANSRKDFLEFINEDQHILECNHVTGEFSMTVKAIFKEMSDLEVMVGKIQQFGNTQTLIILSSPIDHKNII